MYPTQVDVYFAPHGSSSTELKRGDETDADVVLIVDDVTGVHSSSFTRMLAIVLDEARYGAVE